MNGAEIGVGFILFGAVLGVFLLGTWTIGAGWEPTSSRKVRRMLELSGVGPSDVVYDLGSGDGRVIIEAARTCGARSVGIEADPVRVAYSRLVISLRHLNSRVRVIWGNFFHVDIGEATVVTVFLTQGTNRRLKPKLLTELKAGTRVVSYVWTFDGWPPAVRDEANELALYIVPPLSSPKA